MMNLKDEYGTIIKIDTQKSFLHIKEAFVFQEDVTGMIVFQFRTYDKSRKQGNKITNSVDIYMDSNEAAYFAEIMKSGRMKKLCQQAKKEAEDKGSNGAYAFGYVKYGGNASASTSRQLKLQLGEDGKIWIKAMEGPGIIGDNGQIKPNYKDNEASARINIGLTDEQMQKIGISLERAIRYFDIWSAMGTVKENVTKMQYRKIVSMNNSYIQHEEISAADMY